MFIGWRDHGSQVSYWPHRPGRGQVEGKAEIRHLDSLNLEQILNNLSDLQGEGMLVKRNLHVSLPWIPRLEP